MKASDSPLNPHGDALPRPFGNTYWVWAGRVLAGEHPGLPGPTQMPGRLEALVAHGITHFIDLTSASDPVPSYTALLAHGAMDAQHLHHPITDFGVPTVATMQGILQDIQDALKVHGRVYLHCRAGIGRTGTVAATWLVQQGLAPEAALALLLQKWQCVDKLAAEPHTPETPEQRSFVLNWPDHMVRHV